MPVEGLDAGEDLAVVPHGYQDLGVASDGGLEDGEGAGGELFAFGQISRLVTRDDSVGGLPTSCSSSWEISYSLF